MAAAAAAAVLLGGGVAAAVDTTGTAEDPNYSPASQAAQGPEAGTKAGSRPESGNNLMAGPPWETDEIETKKWIANTEAVTLKNTVTDKDGEKSTLTFEVWTVASGTTASKKVPIDDGEYGVGVSTAVASGSYASFKIDPKWLDPNKDYKFRTSAYDGSLYETDWSGWAEFRIEKPVDLTLPAPDKSAPNPNYDNAPENIQTEPLKGGGVTRNTDGSTADDKPQTVPPAYEGKHCQGEGATRLCVDSKPTSKVVKDTKGLKAGADAWCHPDGNFPEANRTKHCESRSVTYYLGGDPAAAKADFTFSRELELNTTDNSFTEVFSIKGDNIPKDFDGGIQLSAFNNHICQGSCKPIEPEGGAWTKPNFWKPGETHTASLTTKYTWDNTANVETSIGTGGANYWYKPDIQIDGTVQSPGVEPLVDYQWSKGNDPDFGKLDQIRCDTFKFTFSGTACVFSNHAPTYRINAKRHPQAAAHAWLLKEAFPKHSGSKDARKPLYYMGDKAQNDRSRNRICPTGWAKENAATGADSALDPPNANGTADVPNCDEFAFASTYNSGGMKKSEGGLNEAVPSGGTTPNGSECVQLYAKKHGSKIHLYNLDTAKAPTFAEVCGRAAISGFQNQGAMNVFPDFRQQHRVQDKDPYWLATMLNATCKDGSTIPRNPAICTMTAR